MRTRKSVCTTLVVSSALALSAQRANAEHVNCWDTQMSEIVAHSAEQTIGNFEVGGVSIASDQPLIVYKCNGTFLLRGERKQYSYLCDLQDAAGDKFSLQNNDATLGAMQYVAGGGTGKYIERAGLAAEYTLFPVNRDGSLPSCDPTQTAGKLP